MGMTIQLDNFKRMEEQKTLEAALYLVPTPVGNREDITLRGLRVLQQADIIACEDTRHTGQLLKLYEIQPKQMVSCHEHNEAQAAERILHDISQGKSAAFCSDAGSPGISDPGYRLVLKAVEKGVKIIPLPGATAFVPALTASGLPTDEVIFMGFPPQKKGRQTFLKRVAEQEATVLLYESPYRLLKLLEEIVQYCGAERKVCAAREISKMHEEFVRGTAEEVFKNFSGRSAVKGEFVVIIGGKPE